jgi:hypothetical protein
MKENVVKQKSFAFALRVVKLAKYLQGEKEVRLSTQACGIICPEQSPKRIIHIQSPGEWGVRYVVYSLPKGGRMSTKELIQAELDTLSDEDLDALYALIKQFIQSKRPAKPRSLMATLRGIQIDAPPDFAANLDLYVSGEKRVEPDLH